MVCNLASVSARKNMTLLSANVSCWRLAVVLLCAATAGQAATAAPSNSQVFTCVTASGRTLTSDRLISECLDREQRVLARDGTVLRIVAPWLTPEERAAKDARERRIAAEKAAQAEAVRRDRNLLQRYATISAHQEAREAALGDLHASMQVSKMRQRELAVERKPLIEESEFYQGKSLPPALRQKLDANDAANAAQRDAQLNLQAEINRINKLFDTELARLKRLWAGAAPGSIGAAPAAEAASAAASAVPAASAAVRRSK